MNIRKKENRIILGLICLIFVAVVATRNFTLSKSGPYVFDGNIDGYIIELNVDANEMMEHILVQYIPTIQQMQIAVGSEPDEMGGTNLSAVC